ncbi:MAG: SNF2 helicase associated domain-containing protein [Ignavibacteriae bacterium]|nr:SNF2 helicase associated domain-containing protein [Ignavibacteriota bacterium]
MNITKEIIRSISEPTIRSRGLNYFKEGRVRIKLFSEKEVVAQVKGTHSYRVHVIYDADKNDWDVSCTCPYDWDDVCKHVVATMYAAMEENIYRLKKVKTQTFGEDTFDADEYQDEFEDDEDESKRFEAIEKTEAQKPQPAQSVPVLKKPSIPIWNKRIDKLLENGQTGIPASNAQSWRLIYQLDTTEYSTTLKAHRLYQKKDGSDGHTVPITGLNSNDYAQMDEIDKLVLPHVARQFGLIVHLSFFYQNEVHLHGLLQTILRQIHKKELYFSYGYGGLKERIEVIPEKGKFGFHFNSNEKKNLLIARVTINDVELPLSESILVLSKPLWIVSNKKLFEVANLSLEQFNELKNAKWKIEIPKDDDVRFRQEIFPRLLERYHISGEGFAVHEQEAPCVKKIYLKEEFGGLSVRLACAYDGVEVQPQNVNENIVVAKEENLYHSIKRDIEVESQARRDVLDTYMMESVQNKFIPRQKPLVWLVQQLPVLVEKGFEVFGQEDLKSLRVRTGGNISVAISSGIDWFDLEMVVEFDGVIAPFKEVYQSIQNDEKFVKLTDGTLGLIPDEWLKKFKRAFALTDAKGSEWKLARGHVSLIDQLFTEAQIVKQDKSVSLYREKFRQFKSIKLKRLHKEFGGSLRPYQKAGYDWLNFLNEFQFNGCLADDMGLGKTIQTLALLQREYSNGTVKPSLIVVPTSIVFNWLNEANRFAPTLEFYNHTGNQRLKSLDEINGKQIIITTYGVLRRDIKTLKDVEFHYVILDESQNIKNPASQNTKAVKVLQSKHRLALTGTPVENNLMELWSQFDFLNPGLLGSRTGFQNQFAKPIEREKDESAAEMLRKIVYPFILRRTKDVVAKELPPKMESVVYCEMEKPQVSLYNYWRDYYRTAILKSIDSVGMQHSKFKVLEGLMKLRQICCHPLLVEPSYKGTSGKFEAWKEMVGDLIAENHKALVFSQFVKMLKVLSVHCDGLEVDYEYLDGATRDREERVQRFQSDENVKMFLISLKAGGTGLNLTAADYVIHYDPWWNPAVEAQATDRTHRIGQTKNVFSYKLITKDSIEEKILQLQEKKKELVRSIITAEAGLMKLITREDVEMLFT